MYDQIINDGADSDIPHFQTVIIMASNCDNCGSKHNEVKSGGETKAMGCRMTLRIEEVGAAGAGDTLLNRTRLQGVDLARDVLKSDTCSLGIPHLELEVGSGALTSRFTTVEGILQAVRDQLEEQSRFLVGDSACAEGEQVDNFQRLFQRLDDMIALREVGTTLVLDDPAGNSYVQVGLVGGGDAIGPTRPNCRASRPRWRTAGW